MIDRLTNTRTDAHRCSVTGRRPLTPLTSVLWRDPRRISRRLFVPQHLFPHGHVQVRALRGRLHVAPPEGATAAGRRQEESAGGRDDTVPPAGERCDSWCSDLRSDLWLAALLRRHISYVLVCDLWLVLKRDSSVLQCYLSVLQCDLWLTLQCDLRYSVTYSV